jgi:hypothetical protein
MINLRKNNKDFPPINLEKEFKAVVETLGFFPEADYYTREEKPIPYISYMPASYILRDEDQEGISLNFYPTQDFYDVFNFKSVGLYSEVIHILQQSSRNKKKYAFPYKNSPFLDKIVNSVKLGHLTGEEKFIYSKYVIETSQVTNNIIDIIEQHDSFNLNK